MGPPGTPFLDPPEDPILDPPEDPLEDPSLDPPGQGHVKDRLSLSRGNVKDLPDRSPTDHHVRDAARRVRRISRLTRANAGRSRCSDRDRTVTLNGSAGGEEQGSPDGICVSEASHCSCSGQYRLGRCREGSDRTTNATGIRSPLLPPLARRKVLPRPQLGASRDRRHSLLLSGCWSDLG